METNEMNRKIAEWMGELLWYPMDKTGAEYWSPLKTKEECQKYCDITSDETWPHPKSPSYHSDWNALMPVVERIKQVEGHSSLGVTLYFLRSRKKGFPFNNAADLQSLVFNYINKNS